MSVNTIVKIVFLVIMTICAIIALFSKFIVIGVSKKNKNQTSAGSARLMIKLRLGCFVVMLICLLICVVIP